MNVKQKIQNCLEKSVEKQLRSDVEIGCFLSGGLDKLRYYCHCI